MVTGVIGWIVLGLMAGFMAGKLLNKRGEVVPLDMVLGIAGAVVSGWSFSALSGTGVTGFNTLNLLVAGIGAAVLLVGWRVIGGSRSLA